MNLHDDIEHNNHIQTLEYMTKAQAERAEKLGKSKMWSTGMYRAMARGMHKVRNSMTLIVAAAVVGLLLGPGVLVKPEWDRGATC